MKIIAGTFKGHRIQSPKGTHARPTSSRLRESVFNILQSDIDGAVFLDLFSGSGAMGLEALSRGAEHATFVEEHRDSIAAIKKNFASFDFGSRALLFSEDVFKALRHFHKCGKTYDIIFADPPYGHVGDEKLMSIEVLKAVDSYGLLRAGGQLFIEESKTIDLEREALRNLTLKSKRATGKTVLYQYVSQQ